jgi:hypothetical protein
MSFVSFVAFVIFVRAVRLCEAPSGYAYIPRIFVTVATRLMATM